MTTTVTILAQDAHRETRRLCVSCGAGLTGRKRRYCSVECKEQLVFSLRWLTNLLYALNGRYSAFSFTDRLLVVHVVPWYPDEILTFFYSRQKKRTPARDLRAMVMDLSGEWCHENHRTHCRQTASLKVLNGGRKGIFPRESIRPVQMKNASGISTHLSCLKIPKREFERDMGKERLKSAFRKQALLSHPDHGGDSETFRRVFNAYHKLNQWLDKPVYRRRGGVYGHWSWEVDTGKWRPPL